MIGFCWTASCMATHVSCGMRSIALRNSCAGRRKLLTWSSCRRFPYDPRGAGSTEGREARRRVQARFLPLTGELHATWSTCWVLGPRANVRGADRHRQGGRIGGFPLRLGGRGVRVRHGDDPRVDRRADRDDQARLGDLPDARPHPGDDGDDRRDDRPALRRAHAPRYRLVRPAGRRGLARAAIRPPAAAHAGVRRDPAQGARARAPRVRRRDLHPSASRTAPARR